MSKLIMVLMIDKKISIIKKRDNSVPMFGLILMSDEQNRKPNLSVNRNLYKWYYSFFLFHVYESTGKIQNVLVIKCAYPSF